MRKFRLGLCGWGTVAQAFAQLCERNAAALAERYGVQLEIAALSSRRPPTGAAIAHIKQCPDVLDIPALNDLDAVVELIGGTDTATEIARRTLQSGKHLLTANKAMLVFAGTELGDLARQHKVRIGAEGAVAGSIPVMRVLRSNFSFAANEIKSVYGILNGTCNFILSAMDQGQDFAAALAEAQRRGFAEADPTLDLDGTDAASKLAIMLHLIYATPLGEGSVKDIGREGLGGLEPFDFRMAHKFGYRIRHLAIAHPATEDAATQIEARVHLALIPKDTPLAYVQAETNAVCFDCVAAGGEFLQGAGAGGVATASAVLSDALEIALNPASEERFGEQAGSRRISASDQYACPRYLRLDLSHQPGTLARLTALIGDMQINIDSISQHSTGDDHMRRVVLMLTSTAEGKVCKLLETLRQQPDISGEAFQLRVLENLQQ